MKLTKMMIAVAALTGATSTFAAPDAGAIVRLSGASAIKGNVAFALNALCTTAGGTMQEWISGSTISTYVCGPLSGGLTSGTGGTYVGAPASSFVPFDTVSGFVEVRLNVAGGSFTALQTINGGSDKYLNPGLGATVSVGGAVNAGVVGGSTVTEAGIGGLSDVNYDAFASNVLGTVLGIDATVLSNTAQLTGQGQGFGVAVSNALYGAMYSAQVTSGAIPAACSVSNYSEPRCVPSIGKGQMAAIMSSNNFSVAKTLGAQFLASQLAPSTELRYVRRVDTSGTQAAAQNYFLGLGNMTQGQAVFVDPSNRTNSNATVAISGCNLNDLRGSLATDNEVDTAFVASGQINLCDKKQNNLRVLGAPGTGDVRNELNKTTILNGATNYAIGVMSLENDGPTFKDTTGATVNTSYKWIRVQKAMGADSALPNNNANRAAIIAGEYDFYYETWSYTKASIANDAFMNAVIGQLVNGPALKGLVDIVSSPAANTNQSAYNRSGRTDGPSQR